MKFGAVPLAQAQGGVAVHSIRKDGLVLKKGTLIGPGEIAALAQAGITEIVVARIEPGDVSEDAAAAEIAAAVHGEGVRVDRAFTGRANLFAENAGVLVVDKAGTDRLNQVDESITFATLPAYKPVVAGEMVATVKIIPFAVAAAQRDAALAAARKNAPLLRIAPYRIRKVTVVSTLLPGAAWAPGEPLVPEFPLDASPGTALAKCFASNAYDKGAGCVNFARWPTASRSRLPLPRSA